MSLTRFDCSVCGFPLPDDHLDWHTDPETGEDAHAQCCTSCHPPVHEDQQSLAFVAKPHPDGVALRLAQTPPCVDDPSVPAREAAFALLDSLKDSAKGDGT